MNRSYFPSRVVTWFSLALAGGLMLLGCSQSEAPTEAPTAPGADKSSGGGYLGAVSRAKPSAEKTLAIANLKQAIQSFYATEGRYPKNLNELVPGQLPALPTVPAGMSLKYSPTTGEVTMTKQ